MSTSPILLPFPPNSASTMAHPVTHLREQGIALRAAIEDCLHKPKPQPVHTVRSTTRRLEALLELFPLLPHTPKIKKQSRLLRKATNPIRRAAGRVRDLDVHATHLEELPPTPDTAHLIKSLARKRHHQATRLHRTLAKHQPDLVAALDELEKALLPANEVQLSPTRASQIARTWFAHSIEKLSPQDPQQFHELRKAAKLARYIAEAGTETGDNPSPTARHFNQIQQSSGEWHDWQTLSEQAHKHLKPTSTLIPTLERRRDEAHRAALDTLTQTLPKLVASPVRT